MVSTVFFGTNKDQPGLCSLVVIHQKVCPWLPKVGMISTKSSMKWYDQFLMSWIKHKNKKRI